MEITNSDSGLGVALASYQPTSMPPETWGRFRADAIALVSQLQLPNEREARRCMSRLALFLADFAEVRPDATLAELLTREHVDGFLHRLKATDMVVATVRNVQGSLNRLLRAAHGERQHAPRAPRKGLTPYPVDEIHGALAAACAAPDREAADLARTLACALAGHPVPTREYPASVDVVVTERQVTAGDDATSLPAHVPAPTSGVVDGQAVERARTWARTRLGWTLDARRLALTQLVEVVCIRPWAELVGQPGVGHRRLDAALAVIPAASDEELRGWLRHL